MNNKVLVGVLVLVLLAGGAFFVSNSQKKSSEDHMMSQDSMVAPTEVMTNDSASTDAMAEDDSMMKSEVKAFNVSAENFSFSLKEMRVKQGDRVKVVFTNKEGIHDWVLDEFKGAKTKTVAAGESETVEFVADKKGTFEYYCSVGAHRAMGMKGNLIVE